MTDSFPDPEGGLDEPSIHPLAHVSRDATIGARTKVWQFASVIRRAWIGEDCKIASCAIVDGSVIDAGSIVSHGAFIDPGIRIGKNVFVGPLVAFCNDMWPRVSKEGFDMRALIDGRMVVTEVRDGASIGAQALILPGVIIGAGAMVAAGAVVKRDVPAGHLYGRDGNTTEIIDEPSIRRMRAVRSRVPVGA